MRSCCCIGSISSRSRSAGSDRPFSIAFAAISQMTRSEQTAERPWKVPVARREVAETGRRFDLAADERTRAAVAKLAGLRALPRLEARFEVAPCGRDGLHVTGRVSATVGQ